MMTDSGVDERTEAAAERRFNAELLRRQLRIALKRARLELDLTQGATAKRLGWSTSKLVRIEQGINPVSPGDVMAMLSTYGEKDQSRIDELVEMAHRARDARSWADYDDITTPSFREMIGQEQSASTIWKYEPAVVPGYFQTSNYTRALLRALGHSGRALERRLELRAKRQQILEIEPRPRMEVIVGEVVFARPAGDSEVMLEQIERLRQLAQDDNGISLHLMPFEAGPHVGMDVPFTILEFNDFELDDVLYLEDADKSTTSHDDPEELVKYFGLFDDLKETAERRGSFESHLDRIMSERYAG
jgi:DNA-binding XRE family transcriptional regulator